jgi:hypothetical protein
MANTFQDPLWYLKEVGRGYENSLMFVGHMKKIGSDEFKVEGARVGNTVNYRLPPLFYVSDGAALDVQNVQNRSVPVTLTNQKHVDMGWSTWEETTELNTAQAESKAAGDALASVIDGLAFSSVYRDVANAIGTLGTTPTTTLLMSQAGRFLTDQSVTLRDRVAVIDPEHAIVLANAVSTVFNPSQEISDAFRDAFLGRGQNLTYYQDQNRPLFTSGAATGASTPIVNGASQTGASLITSGWASFSGVRGDTFTLAGVFTVNPLSKISTGRLQRFVLTANITDAGGAATLSISPSIITSGAYQNVSNSPANSAVLTYWNMAAGGTFAATVSPTGMVFHPAAFAFVTADLVKPGGGARVERVGSKIRGVYLRMAEQWDVRSDQNITRIDTIVGAATLDQRFACRVQG